MPRDNVSLGLMLRSIAKRCVSKHGLPILRDGRFRALLRMRPIDKTESL